MNTPFDGYPYINNMQTTVQALGLAVQGSIVYYLSAAGPGTSCKSVWSSLVAPRHTIDCRPWGYDLSGSGNLQTVYQGLPNSNYQHLVTMYRESHFLIAADPKGALYYDDLEIDHVQERERLLNQHLPAVITRFVSYLTAFTNVPVVAEWGEQLWQIGLSSGGIQALEAYGDCIGAWLINKEYDWLAAVQAALTSGQISFPSPSTLPTPLPTPMVESSSSPTNHASVGQSVLFA